MYTSKCIPNPFMAFLNISASVSASKEGVGFNVPSYCRNMKTFINNHKQLLSFISNFEKLTQIQS